VTSRRESTVYPEDLLGQATNCCQPGRWQPTWGFTFNHCEQRSGAQIGCTICARGRRMVGEQGQQAATKMEEWARVVLEQVARLQTAV